MQQYFCWSRGSGLAVSALMRKVHFAYVGLDLLRVQIQGICQLACLHVMFHGLQEACISVSRSW